MKQEIKCDIRVFEDTIEITPIDTKMKDNSIYEVYIEEIKAEYEPEIIKDIYVGFQTRMYPYYTSSYAVTAIVGQYEVPEDIILFHIREASRYVDYALKRIDTSRMSKEDIYFRASQYVKYAAAYDCILRLYVDKAAMSGIKGELADVKFDNNGGTKGLDGLLKALERKKDLWDDILRGYEDVGKAAPIGTVRGIRAIPEINSVPVNWGHGTYNSNRNNMYPYRSIPRGGYSSTIGNSRTRILR